MSVAARWPQRHLLVPAAHHLQQDGPGLGLVLVEPLLQLLLSLPLRVVDHLVRSDAAALHTNSFFT